MKTPGLSLRIKFSLALSSIAILSVLLVGFIAKMLVMERFSQQAMDRAFQHFSQDVSNFIRKYGSWQAGREAEGFGNYVRRTRTAGNTPPPPNRFIGQRPPGAGVQPPAPPFRFVLTDPDNIVLHGSEKYPANLPLQPTLQKKKMPITLQGELVAYAVPLGQANLSDQDMAYLKAVDLALVYAAAIVGLLATLLGILLGNRLSASLQHLTEAIISIKPGEIRKDVEVQSKDEVAVLADSFNAMSHQLADAYEELEQAHEKVTEQAEQLLQLSILDELTGLHNRRYFRDESSAALKRAQRYAQPLSIMLADIDFFKKINDSYGHATGDEVLRQVASIMQQTLRETDIIARYGGEEFVVCFPETDKPGAAALCERLRSAIESHNWHLIHPALQVTLSIGLCSDTTLDHIDKMLANADERLYFAKENGRNQLAG